MTDKNQSDRTLLELAAKAAFGITATTAIESGWNPLTDDGDALRLAVKLGMKIYPGEAYPWNEEYADWPIQFGCAVDEDEEPDSYAATRRAIVRAAASIGETL
jgi:hypothetical protein